MKKRLLNIMMGTHNPDFQQGLSSVFECHHFNWLPYQHNLNLLQREVLGAFKRFNPHIVFMHIQSQAIEAKTARYMAQKATVVNWTGDVRYPLPQHYLEIGKNIHITLFTNVNDVETCLGKRVNADFLQTGYDSTQFNKQGRKENVPDIIFMGANYAGVNFPLTTYRQQMVQRLRNEFGNRFGLYGAGWGKLANGQINSYEEEGTVYRSCKIAVNLSHFDYRRYSSDRMFRILGSGAFCLTHNFKEIETDFEIGKHVDVWNNLDELVSKINYYLSHVSKRELIANAGSELAVSEYTWHRFAEKLQSIINK